MVWLSFVYLFIIIQQCYTQESFNFKDVNSWAEKYPQCGDNNQSPIAISTDNLISKTYDSPLTSYYENELGDKYYLSNTGTGLKLETEWPEGKTPYFSGGPLGETKYIYSATWFRWSKDGDDKCDHIIDGESFPLSANLEYYNENYGSIENAQNYSDGLMIVAPKWAMNDKKSDTSFSKVISKISEVIKPGSKVEIEPFRASDSRNHPDDNPMGIFFYSGSQVTPPCAPVKWFLPDYVHFMTSDDLEAFRSVKLNNNDDHNTRPVQLLNGRDVYKIEKKLA